MKALVRKAYGFWFVSWAIMARNGVHPIRIPMSFAFSTWQEAIDYAIDETERRKLKFA